MSTTTEYTIDELARETGMTVRNIRAHQSRGLLPPPEVRARTGYYGPDHVVRVKLIQDMQAEGFNLRGIERLLNSQGAGEELLHFGRAVRGAFAEEEPEFITADELAERFGGRDERFLRDAAKQGLIVPLGDDRYEVPSPTMLRAGESLIGLGVPVGHMLAVGSTVRRQADSIAAAFVRLFTEDVMRSRDLHAIDSEQWAALGAALERLRPLAAEVVGAAFAQSMGAAIEAEIQKRIGR